MNFITHPVRLVMVAAAFVAVIYLAYLLMYLAPTVRLRHWGRINWWQSIQVGPKWPARPARLESAQDQPPAVKGVMPAASRIGPLSKIVYTGNYGWQRT